MLVQRIMIDGFMQLQGFLLRLNGKARGCPRPRPTCRETDEIAEVSSVPVCFGSASAETISVASIDRWNQP